MTSDTRAMGAELARRLDRLAKDLLTEAARALRDVGEETLAASKDLVPVDTGALQDSGRFVLGVEQGKVLLRIIYGGADVDYAADVHEDFEVEHKNGGQAKFLETPVMAAASTLAGDVASKIDLRRAVR